MSTGGGADATAPRIDAHLVSAGLARSRGQARELIDAGRVTLDGVTVVKASERVAPGASVAAEADAWVGRAAYKLLAAFEIFGAETATSMPATPATPATPSTPGPAGAPQGRIREVRGARCLDLGASTGGFTQVLLERGASQVVALDVGHGQLAPRLREDPRVVERSGVNVRDVRPGDLGDPFDVIVADLSFISLRLVLPVIAGQLTPNGDAIVLVKPQFEVGRERLSKGGIVRAAAERHRAVADVLHAAVEAGFVPTGLARSPVTGSSGNVEYLGWLRHGATHADAAAGSAHHDAEIDRLIDLLDEGST